LVEVEVKLKRNRQQRATPAAPRRWLVSTQGRPAAASPAGAATSVVTADASPMWTVGFRCRRSLRSHRAQPRRPAGPQQRRRRRGGGRRLLARIFLLHWPQFAISALGQINRWRLMMRHQPAALLLSRASLCCWSRYGRPLRWPQEFGVEDDELVQPPPPLPDWPEEPLLGTDFGFEEVQPQPPQQPLILPRVQQEVPTE
uniref:C2 domain-containing protein n=1 Tax=Macrostomum lignano TaxID=282301 RepID=A0A1I8FFZ3_9PLAT